MSRGAAQAPRSTRTPSEAKRAIEAAAREEQPIPRLLSPEEVGRILGLGVPAVMWYHKHGHFPLVRLGNRKAARFRQSDIQKFIDSGLEHAEVSP